MSFFRTSTLLFALTATLTAPLFLPAAYSETTSSLKDQSQPIAVISATIDKIVATVEKFPKEDQTKERRTELLTIIKPKCDYTEMAKRSLGSHWKKIEKAEQDEYTTVFSELLSRTYLKHVETVKPGMIKIVDQNVKKASNVGGLSIAIVHTDVKHKGEVFPLNYKMVERSDGWKVYDIVVENIGLVSNYRNEFSGIIRKDGFSGLLSQLKTKVG